jgi:L-threonylcarbamoyladenylate synthase
MRRSDPHAELLSDDPERAAACLRAGGLAVIPTETVYGLAADASDPQAVARVFEVKGRPADHPLIVHIAAAGELADWAAEVPPFAVALADACWPGPLTMLLRRSERVGDWITGGRDTVGIRVPAHRLTQRVLALVGGLAAPSANRFGKVSPTTAQHVLDDLGELLDPRRDVVLDGGASPVGVESTIVDCTSFPPQMLRPGGIPTENIAQLLETPLAAPAGPARAPGMLASHYAPRATVHLVDRRADAIAAADRFRAAGIAVRVIDESSDLVRYARNLYAELRAADDDGCTDVIAVLPPPIGLGHAIRDRLHKAAAREE